MRWNTQQLNTEQNLPLYRILANHLRDSILSGELPPGAKLPSSRELQKCFRLSSITVEHGIKVLVREGWLVRRPRLGTFIAQEESRIPLPAAERLKIKVLLSCAGLPNGGYWFDILLMIESCLRRHGAEMLFEYLNLEERLPAITEITGGCDAVIMCGTNPMRLAEELFGRKIPFILIGSPDKKTPLLKKMDAFIGDDEAKALFAAKTLFDMGHRRIAAIIGPEDTMFAQEQQNGFNKAKKLYGLDDSEFQVYIAKALEAEAGERVGYRILCRENRPTALLASDIMISMGFTQAAYKLGFSIPEDISILTIGANNTIAKFMTPPITGLNPEIPTSCFVSDIIDRLFDQINNPEHKCSNLINRDFSIIFRKSLIQNKSIEYKNHAKKERQNESLVHQ